MDTNELKEQFSLGYVQLLCSVAGLGFENKGRHADNRGIDLTIRSPGPVEGVDCVTLDVQVKCTTSGLTDCGHILKFDLEVKNYHELIETCRMTQLVLIIVHVPPNIQDWAQVRQNQTTLNICGYWVDLQGHEPSKNKSTIRISIPKENLLTPDILNSLISQSAQRFANMKKSLEES